MKVLCYAPYSIWTLHTSRLVTILHGLELRGCDISYITCDGTFAECDLHQPSKGKGRNPNDGACHKCQAATSEYHYRLGRPFHWLSRWLSPTDFHNALEWSNSIARTELLDAEYDSWPIGRWIQSSVHSHFRANDLDIHNDTVERTYRRYLYSGYLACVGLNAALDSEEPDVLLLFNGRMAPMRIALELARQRGIRAITEERGFVPGYVRLVENTHCLDPNPFYGLEQAWRDTQLSLDELMDLETLLSAHTAGQSHEMPLFAAPVSGHDHVRQHFSIEPSKTLISLFSSSTDEPGGQPEAAGSFSTQHDWINATVAAVAADPTIELVIRAHPNSGGKRAVGVNTQELDFFSQLSDRLPDNATLIQPEDDISSFDLMAAAAGGLVWHSSLGVEMASMGKPVLRAGHYWFRDASFMIGNTNADSYGQAFLDLLSMTRKPVDLNRTVDAWRFAYSWFFRQSLPFPLVSQPDWSSGEPAYTTLETLKPGHDASLDRICDAILNRTTLHSEPMQDGGVPAAEPSEAERTAVESYTRRFRVA